jgi:hypothetical protein
MSNMNRGLFGSRGQLGDDPGRRTLVCDEGYDRDPQDYHEKKRREEPVDVVVKVDPGCGCEKKDDKCCCKIVDVALNAATGGAGPLAAATLSQALPLVSVTIDADCICDPSILLTFTTLVVVPTAVGLTTLNFEVVRTTNIVGTPINIGPVFTLTLPAAVAPAITAPFTFQVFDSELRSGTYTYSVLLTAGTVIGTDGTTLINSTLSALAVSSVN